MTVNKTSPMRRHTIRAVGAACLAFTGFCATPTLAATTADLLATAPVFQLILDNSGSSPATDAGFVTSAWPIVEGWLRKMPLGTVIIVNSVGDASLTPMTMRTRIQQRQTAEGAPLDQIIPAIKNIVLGFPKRIQGAAHGQTHMVGGIFDASRNINKSASTKNVILLLSDLIEFSPIANCYKEKGCTLPKPKFNLEGTEVLALGVGRGLPSDREMALFGSWEQFFTQTGATFELKKTF